MAYTLDGLRTEYLALWAGSSILPERKSEVYATARQIIALRPRYDVVSRATGVPWYLIGIYHSLECSLSFEKHLHNGDSLARRTVREPKGYPKTHDGPFTWEESAIDALKIKKFDKITDWSIERIAFCLEKMNGYGYRRASINIHSPYLWSFTTAYRRGKFVRDGVYSKEAVSQQVGGMALLKALMELEPLQIDVRKPTVVEIPSPKAEIPEPKTVPTAVQSKTNRSLVSAVFLWFEAKFQLVQSVLPAVHSDVTESLTPIEALAKLTRQNLDTILPALALWLMVYAIIRHTRDRKVKIVVQGDPKDTEATTKGA